MSGDGENWPKQLIWCHLVHMVRLFLFLHRVFYMLTNNLYYVLGYIYVLKLWRGLGWATTMETGPNDAFSVFWAISMCFLFILILFRFNWCSKGTGRVSLGDDKQSRLKRLQTMLGLDRRGVWEAMDWASAELDGWTGEMDSKIELDKAEENEY